ncbi:MAG: helicase C-terminal domain-containing protein [Chlamydia sp.]
MRYKKLTKTIEELFSPQKMQLFFSQYEERQGQQDLAQTVLKTFEENGVSLLEAGTGTGKSLGYLIPAILWALETGERIIISTHTIPLQEQLLYKEIPLALQLIGKEVGVGIARGMSNYLCELKLQQQIDHLHVGQESLFHKDQEEIFQDIYQWSRRQNEPVTKNRLPMAISKGEWRNVAAENEQCLKSQCPFFSSCHFFRSRKRLSDYKIIVVNHHLLLHDLLQRSEAKNWEGSFVLPPYTRVIIDEGHHLEEVATSLFQVKVERFDHLHTIKRFHYLPSAVKERSSLSQLLLLIQKDSSYFESTLRIAIIHSIEFELRRISMELEKSSELFFEALFTCAMGYRKKEPSFGMDFSVGQFRITPFVSQSAPFQEAFTLFLEHKKSYAQFGPVWDEFCDLFKKKMADFESRDQTEKRQNGLLSDAIRPLLGDLKMMRERLHKQIGELALFFASIDDPEKVAWIEWSKSAVGGIQIACIISSFYIGKELRQRLFDPMGSTLLVSATLTTKGNFSFIKGRLGIASFQEETSGALFEEIYPSPFPYEKNALFILGEDFPSSEEPHYIERLQETLFNIAKVSCGGALFLFTSYSMLEKIYPALSRGCIKEGLSPMKQGEMPRSQLLDAFRKNMKGVLCATDSFWEGVDIPGEALRTVVITKLPFDVPSDPMYQARHEAMEKKGLNSFIHYGLPRAIVKFKQAFGRLIRRKTDFGAVVCLDSRIAKKGYGKAFLDSLPSCQIWQGPTDKIGPAIEKKMAMHL